MAISKNEQVGQLYHTFPLGMLGFRQLTESSSLFIESSACMKSDSYRHFFVSRRFNHTTILDCGVGMTPDLKNPTAHTSSDPHWAIRYLKLILDIQPGVVIIPDILNDAQKTFRNYQDYMRVFDKLDIALPDLMYVIQGKTKEEAAQQIELFCGSERLSDVQWIGFPRIVDYYGDLQSDVLTGQRISFVSRFYTNLREAGYKIHLLGMNSIEELKFAAGHNISIDTRLAAMAAVAGMNVTTKRRDKLNIDLVRSFTVMESNDTLKNIETLNRIYYGAQN